jgi:hypothetical protein
MWGFCSRITGFCPSDCPIHSERCQPVMSGGHLSPPHLTIGCMRRKAEDRLLYYSRWKFTSKLRGRCVMGCCGFRKPRRQSIPTLALRVALWYSTVCSSTQPWRPVPSEGMDDRGRRERSQFPSELFAVCNFFRCTDTKPSVSREQSMTTNRPDRYSRMELEDSRNSNTL